MNRTQNNVMEMDSLAHVKGIFGTVWVTQTDVVEDAAEDVDALQSEVNSWRIEVNVTATPTGIARTQEESARHTQNVTMKWLPSPKWWKYYPAIMIDS